MSKKDTEGFTTKQGLIATAALVMSILTGIVGLLSEPVMLIIFITGILIFFAVYGIKLCSSCTKNCPFNPDFHFWKRMIDKFNL
jgi:hypothetical protein